MCLIWESMFDMFDEFDVFEIMFDVFDVFEIMFDMGEYSTRWPLLCSITIMGLTTRDKHRWEGVF